MTPTPLSIDDFGPLPLHRPATAAEVGDLVRRAAADAQAVYPVGGRTQLHLGLPPTKPGVALDLTALDQVLDYPARDMTVTVQAGVRVARLRQVLAAERQRLPIDVPRAGEATLGGALATNASGPRRLGWGTLRDYVIGLSTVNDEGHETKAGGRVVKNVAGYDLCKLHVGALGTLGVVTQVTLKLRPVPERSALVHFGCADAALAGILDTLHATRTRPVCVELLNRAAVAALHSPPPETPWSVVAGFEDNDEAVRWQVQQVMKEVAATGVAGCEVQAGACADAAWAALAEGPAAPDGALAFKANLLPAAVAGFAQLAATLEPEVRLHCHAGSGVVRGVCGPGLTLERASSMLKALHDGVRPAAGNVVLTHCPVAWKRVLPVWGLPRGDGPLMRQVKEKLDPRRLFNPGRFIDGI